MLLRVTHAEDSASLTPILISDTNFTTGLYETREQTKSNESWVIGASATEAPITIFHFTPRHCAPRRAVLAMDGGPCTRQSFSEFNRQSRDFQHSRFLVLFAYAAVCSGVELKGVLGNFFDRHDRQDQLLPTRASHGCSVTCCTRYVVELLNGGPHHANIVNDRAILV